MIMILVDRWINYIKLSSNGIILGYMYEDESSTALGYWNPSEMKLRSRIGKDTYVKCPEYVDGFPRYLDSMFNFVSHSGRLYTEVQLNNLIFNEEH